MQPSAMNLSPHGSLHPTMMRSLGASPSRMSRHSSSTSLDGLHHLLENEWREVQNTLRGRERNKKEIRELNEKLASRIEKTRYLQAKNANLTDEMRDLKEKWLQESDRTHRLHDDQMKQLRRIAEDAQQKFMEREAIAKNLEQSAKDNREKAAQAQSHIEHLRSKVDAQAKELALKDGELALLRRKVDSLEDERNRERPLLLKLKQDVAHIQGEIQMEKINTQNANSKSAALQDELTAKEEVHRQQLAELRALIRSDKDNIQEFWNNELARAIHEIQEAYDQRFDDEKQEIEDRYSQKLQEVIITRHQSKTENTRLFDDNQRLKGTVDELRNKLADSQKENTKLISMIKDFRGETDDELRRLREENAELKLDLERMKENMATLLNELNALTDAKLNIEAEVQTYRRLLDVENYDQSEPVLLKETQVVKTNDYRPKGNAEIHTAVTANYHFDKSFVGPLAIEECSPDGRYISVGNHGHEKENLTRWRLVRTIDRGRLVIRFTFSDGIVYPGKQIRVWARGHKPRNADDLDMECAYTTWGQGELVESILYDPNGHEKARHLQRTAVENEP